MAFDIPLLVTALGIPEGAAVNQRVPKKMLIEMGAPTAADKRAITDGVEDVLWIAALKPATVGIPAYQDPLRDYLEIAVLSVSLRPGSKESRIAELVHRAVPYPAFLILQSQEGVSISLAHKRWAQNEAGKTVLDGNVQDVALHSAGRPDLLQQFVDVLSLEKQPRLSLHTLYQGWMDMVVALQTAFVTGVFTYSTSREQAVARHQSLLEVKRLRVEIARLKAVARKEKQIARQVDLNLEIKRLEKEETSQLALLRTETT